MASEIRVNTINNRSGLGTISITNSGAVFSGVTTFAQIKTTSGEVTVGTGASVFSPATNVLALGTNNAERVRIDSSGNIGIGLTNPQTALVVERDWVNNYGSINIKSSSDVLSGVGFRTDGGYAGGFIYRDGTTGNFFELNAQGSREIRALLNGSEALRIDSSGRLLVGTNGASYTTTAVFEGNSASATGQGQIYLNKGDTTVADGTVLGILRFGATGDRRGADIRGAGDGTWTADSSHPTSLLFMTTAASATSPTERMRINSAGNIGIGEADPSPLGGEYRGMDVGYKGSGISGRTGNPTFTMRSNIYYDGSNWRYGEGNTSAGVLSVGGNQLIFEAAASGTAGATATISEKFRINSSGNLVLPSGAGIDFSATANGSGTTSSGLLDDYEEGTWTPKVSFGGSDAGVTYGANEGAYTKVGRLVTCYGLIYLTSNGTATGNATIFNLPFTSANNLLNNTALEGGGHNTYQSACAGTIYGPMGLAVANNNTFAYYYGATTTGGNMGNMTESNLTDAYDCRFILWYYTDS